MLRREIDVLREAIQYEVASQRKRERPKRTWRSKVEKEIRKFGLKKERCDGEKAMIMRIIQPPPFTG